MEDPPALPIAITRACRALLLPLVLLPGGCNLGPDYARPSLQVPAAFRATADSAAQAWPAPEWWTGFGSAELDGLIAEARLHNNDLQAAIARVRQADAQTRISGAPLLPTVRATAGANVQQVDGTGARSATLRSYAATPLSVSYELDFWQRNLASYQAAQANALGTRFDQEVVALQVVCSVAITYFTALAYTDRLAVARHNLADAEQNLAVIRGRLAVGTATALDEAQEEAVLDGIRANIPALTSSRDQAVIGLGILVGRPPETIALTADTLTRLPAPQVRPGLPSELLARRPDVAYAEAELVAQNGSVRAARAAFFPSVSLTGSAGWSSTALTTLFGPAGFGAALAGNAAQTIFDNGNLAGQLQLARGRYDELLADYRRAVLQAFTDVENALTAYRDATEQEGLEQQAVATAQRAADIARAQLGAGTVDVTTLLTAQTTLYSDQDALAQIRLSRFTALIDLYQALGGGWTQPPGAIPGAA
jgi:NodT family efflux transporter outer membrane factor (OMF) lipoprotein